MVKASKFLHTYIHGLYNRKISKNRRLSHKTRTLQSIFLAGFFVRLFFSVGYIIREYFDMIMASSHMYTGSYRRWNRGKSEKMAGNA